MDEQFNKIQNFDIKVTLSRIMDADELNYIRSIRHVKAGGAGAGKRNGNDIRVDEKGHWVYSPWQ